MTKSILVSLFPLCVSGVLLAQASDPSIAPNELYKPNPNISSSYSIERDALYNLDAAKTAPSPSTSPDVEAQAVSGLGSQEAEAEKKSSQQKADFRNKLSQIEAVNKHKAEEKLAREVDVDYDSEPRREDSPAIKRINERVNARLDAEERASSLARQRAQLPRWDQRTPAPIRPLPANAPISSSDPSQDSQIYTGAPSYSDYLSGSSRYGTSGTYGNAPYTPTTPQSTGCGGDVTTHSTNATSTPGTATRAC